jgi:hypothetical protein
MKIYLVADLIIPHRDAKRKPDLLLFEEVCIMDELREKALKAQREYARKWRAKNKDKVREINRRYWERVAQRADAAAEPDKREETK